MPRLFSLLLVVLALPHAVWAQNCRKGIPCGNTCIAASRTCRVGTGTAVQAAPSTRHTADSAPPATTTLDTGATRIEQLRAIRTLYDTQLSSGWVALSSGYVYYRRSCQAARELPADQIVIFNTEAEARRSGRTPSKVPGCQ